jgi:endo-1,4-beta-xylanase
MGDQMGYRTRLVAFVVGLLATLALAAPAAAATTTPPAQLCEISITVPTQWANGYIVNVNVRNISDRPVSVYASVNIQPPGYIMQGWNGTFTVSGTTVWIRPWNPVMQPGASINLGYVGSGPVALPVVYCQ